MPVFEYECSGCHHITEEIHSISENVRETVCEKCNSPAFRIISLSSFQLVGSGWCRDGYTSAKDKGKRAGVAV